MSGAPSTSVPFPVFGTNGFIAPPESAVLAGRQQDINGAFGGNLNPSLSTPQGLLASSDTAIIGDSFAMFLWYCNQVDPAYNSGRMQDAIGRIYFITRIPGAPTVQPSVCSGLNGVEIPIGALAQDQAGNLWIAQQSGTIASGTVTLNFACTVNGPTAAPTSLSVYQAIPGWDSVAPSGDVVLGNNVETAAAFEARRAQSVGWNAMGPLGSILGAVLGVPGVLDAYVTENDEDTSQTIGGVSLVANSLYVCALGGSASAVAAAIWSRKMPGCAYNGNTTQIVRDPSPQYAPPIPQYAVTFETPTVVPFAVLVTINNSNLVPANAAALVQSAIVSAFAGGDGGPRAKIGSLVLASRYYADIVMLGATYSQSTASSASFTASISGSLMSVSAVQSGALAVGQTLADTTGLLTPGTVILALGTGNGGIGTYMVSQSQNLATEAMTSSVPATFQPGWGAQLIEILIGISGAAASFTGSISGTTLTVSAVASGALAIGQMLQDGTAKITPGTTIVSGSGDSWTVSVSQTVSSESITATTLTDEVQMNINQAPAIAAANVALVLAG